MKATDANPFQQPGLTPQASYRPRLSRWLDERTAEESPVKLALRRMSGAFPLNPSFPHRLLEWGEWAAKALHTSLVHR